MNDKINDNNLSMTQSTERSNTQNDLSLSQETLSNGYEYTKIMNNNTLSKQRKLILHFDNRNTLQVSFNFCIFILFLYLIRLQIMYQQQQSNKVCKKNT